MAVNFVVREENLWQVARYMQGSLGELEQLGLSGPEICLHGWALLARVQEAQALPDAALPPPVLNLIDRPGYRQTFKALKEQIQLTANKTGLSSELLASQRQINQLTQRGLGCNPHCAAAGIDKRLARCAVRCGITGVIVPG